MSLLLRAESCGELQARHAFLYRTHETLCVREVRALLEQYKELVLKYEMLSQVWGRGGAGGGPTTHVW